MITWLSRITQQLTTIVRHHNDITRQEINRDDLLGGYVWPGDNLTEVDGSRSFY